MKRKCKILCLWNQRSSECDAEASVLVRRLQDSGMDVGTDAEAFDGTADLIVLLGGDGFLMESLHDLDYPKIPVFGVNFGSVGFLMNRKSSLRMLLESIESDRFVAEKHAVLEARIETMDGESRSVRAFNDFFLERATRQSVRVRVSLDGVALNQYAGDGFVISTAAGSTAYNLAARGPVLHPDVQGLVMTPLYPHRAFPFHSMQFPLVVPLTTRIRIEVNEPEKRSMRLVADGRSYEEITWLEVGHAGHDVRLLRTPEHSFARTLKQKIIGE